MISFAKRSAVDALSSVGWLSGKTRPERCHQERLLIVTFHRVLPELERAQYPYPGLAVTPSELSFCLGYFAQHYRVDLLSRQHARMRAGERSPKPLLAITFDDGQWDNFAHAEPVLRTHQLQATFYIPTQAVERGELIWHDRLGYAVLATLADERSSELRGLFSRHGLA
ncbi:MAG TPA: polysaccharide deacetylase family protein, partial [Polyangiales bacterium]|nr:polysaccharide deacetylase family protein [Polyangiales bacterium]